MVAIDEDALICDFAETYHIYDYRALPVQLCATLASGLRANSRIKSKLSGFDYATLDNILTAMMVDELATLVWFQTEDGPKGINRPASMVEILQPREDKEAPMTFNSVEDFEAMRKKLLGGV